MKLLKPIFLTILFLIVHIASAQNVPQKVKDKFETKYPDASQVSWLILENQNGFQVNFLDGKKHKHSVFSIASEWTQTTTMVNLKSELPALVRLAIDESYPNSIYDWMEWFESPGDNYFTVAVTSGTEEKEEFILTVTKKGQIRSASTDNEDHL